MMSEWLVHAALVVSFDMLEFGQDGTAYEEREFTPPSDGSTFYVLKNMPAGRDPLTLGSDGEDQYTGVFQIDVNAAQGQGVKTALEAAAVLTAYYKAGAILNHGGQVVHIRRSEASPARRDAVRLVVSVSVYWEARIPRI